MMEEKNDDDVSIKNVPINVAAHTSNSEHDLGDDEWSKSQYKLLENRLCNLRCRTIVHWKMRRRCLTCYHIFYSTICATGGSRINNTVFDVGDRR